jgi:hypothetical protein
MRKSLDPKTHAMLHPLHAVLRSFVDGMKIELDRYDAHIKAKAHV